MDEATDGIAQVPFQEVIGRRESPEPQVTIFENVCLAIRLVVLFLLRSSLFTSCIYINIYKYTKIYKYMQRYIYTPAKKDSENDW